MAYQLYFFLRCTFEVHCSAINQLHNDTASMRKQA